MYNYLNTMSLISDIINTILVIILIGAVIYFSSMLAKILKED